jgi:two-component system, chemotaxis family, chemotaxis protein CheY
MLVMKTILVVEDLVSVQQFVRETLESKGYRTLGATNGSRAYEILVNRPSSISLVLTDYHMPDSTGFDLLKKIRSNEDLKEIPVIFVTAESNPDLIKAAESAGITSWIKKPYRSEIFLGEIEKVMSETPCGNSF